LKTSNKTETDRFYWAYSHNGKKNPTFDKIYIFKKLQKIISESRPNCKIWNFQEWINESFYIDFWNKIFLQIIISPKKIIRKMSSFVFFIWNIKKKFDVDLIITAELFMNLRFRKHIWCHESNGECTRKDYLKSTHARGTLRNIVKLETAITRLKFFRIISNLFRVYSGPYSWHWAQKKIFSRHPFFGGVGMQHSIRNRLLSCQYCRSKHDP
jgi:hypothetical protein